MDEHHGRHITAAKFYLKNINIYIYTITCYSYSRIQDRATYFSVVGEKFLQIVVFKDGQNLLVAATRTVAFTLDLFQRLEEVEADQRVAPFNLQFTLDRFDVLQIFFEDARDLGIDHADHNVSGHICAALQLLGSLGRADNGADADDGALVLARQALPDPFLVHRLVARVALLDALFALDLERTGYQKIQIRFYGN